MKKVYLIRYSEPAVKGSYTRSKMISRMILNIRKALGFNRVNVNRVYHEHARIIVEVDQYDLLIDKILSNVFGVKSFSPACFTDTADLRRISEVALELFCNKIRGKEFMVRVRRTGKHPFTSKDAEREIGGFLYDNCNPRKVNLTNPEYAIHIEIRDNTSYLYDKIVDGPGGLPLGSESKVLTLFSGGFDSALSAWMVMKRGSPTDLIYYDFATEDNWKVALELATALYSDHIMDQHPMKIYRVHFHETAEVISRMIRKNYRILVLRRLMFQHAAKLALSKHYLALVTGESLGQVSSQTVESMYVTSSHLQVPILRPVVGFDKDDIVKETMKLGFYDIASRQTEFCSYKGARASPRPEPPIFNEEFLKITMILESIWPPKIDVYRIP
ncbi:MAG: tRNA 4-thiouridine(8) synthase ThiI [Desulfurococcales archaeon]|nr:tRNA 4-thiouridine(8) synthase ThiI [Desulfurococcales archaeon]